MIYLTGDTHNNFQSIARFCSRMNTKPSDIMIILGKTLSSKFASAQKTKRK